MVVMPVVAAFAVRTNTLEKGASEWNKPESYTDKSFVPGKADVVLIQAKSTNFLYTTDSASLDVVTNLGAVILKGLGNSSALVVDVPEGMTNFLHCPVYGDGIYASTAWKNGEIVKRGPGWLDLMAIGKRTEWSGADYFTGIRVEKGILRLPQTCHDTSDNTEKARYCQVGYVIVESGATFIPAKHVSNTGRGTTYLKGLSGGGTLKGNATDAYWFIVKDVTPYGPFSGKVEGFIRARVENGGVFELAGVESTGFNQAYLGMNNGTLAAMKFGNKGESSSLGNTTTFQIDQGGGRLVYLGTGEVSNRDFQIIAVDNPFYLDGGAHGGLVLTGAIANKKDSSSPAKMRGMVFTGSNETACVFAGTIASSSLFVNGVNYALYMSKEGVGTWRFTDNPRRENANGFAVREGTLQFDSLLEAGLVCSLGTSTNLTDGYRGEYDASRARDYAFNLGGTSESGASNEPTFEYTGGTGVVCTTRPIVLSGNARIKNDTDRAFRFKGVSGLGDGEKTLTLTGSNSGQNEIASISDGPDGGKIGVKKTGVGTWRLSGDLSFTGGITVEGGRLVVVNPSTNMYSWFRWTIKEIVSDTGIAVFCEEFGLFDKANVRQNVGLEVTEFVSDIAPGQVSTEFPVSSYTYVETTGSSTPGPGTIDCMFNHKQDYGMWINNHSFTGERRQWLAFTMRLTNNAPEIATFDYVYPYKNPHGLAPKTYTLEGSLNGLNWDELYVTNSACSPHNYTFRWQATGGALVSSTYEHAGGFPIRGHSLREFDVLKNVGAVSVSGGGVLEIEGKRIDVKSMTVDISSGGGTIKNVKFAEQDGELDVAGITGSDTVALPLALEGCEGVESISGWSLSLDGAPSARKIGVRNGVVCVLAKGFAVMVR